MVNNRAKKPSARSTKSNPTKKAPSTRLPLANFSNSPRKTARSHNDDDDSNDDTAIQAQTHGPYAPSASDTEDFDAPPRASKTRKHTHIPDSDDDAEEPPAKKPRKHAVSPEGSDEEEEDSDEEDESSEEDGPAKPASRVKSISRKGQTKKKDPKTRKRVKTGNLSDHHRRIYRKVRILGRITNPFIEIRGIVDIKIDHLAGNDLTEEEERWLPIYDSLVARIPAVGKLLAAEDQDGLDNLLAMAQAMNQGKHSDTANFRRAIKEYIPEDRNYSVDPRFHRTLKSDRGYAHPVTRALLIPQAHIDRLNDKSFWAQVTAGEIAFTADEYPTLMYDQDKADPDDVEAGLLEGHLPIRVLRSILHGPRHAFEPVSLVPESIAAKNGIKTVSGRLIAYAHVQTWFALCTAEKWIGEVNNFNLSAWYDHIVKIFEDDPEDEKALEILAHWNCEIFGNDSGSRSTTRNSVTPAPESAAAKAQARREARRGIRNGS
ncbi:hypothetical protein C8F01DRAFT_1089563 [Mycena amicta]|nr:hypothetical protein C8F01DRAFT_1089563 [Mycena amicta]